jgi:hypothetical protein
VIAAGFLPFLLPLADDPARGFLSTLGSYSAKWRWNESLFAIVEGMVLTISGMDIQQVGPTFVAGVTKAVIAVPVAVACLVLFWRGRRASPVSMPERATGFLVGVAIVAGPIVHPWYVGWALPFAALSARPAFFYLAAASWLSYLPLPAGAPNVSVGVRLIEYVPFYLLLVWQWHRRERITSSPG